MRVVCEAGDPELLMLFRNANFDWEQPLRAGVFGLAEWNFRGSATMFAFFESSVAKVLVESRPRHPIGIFEVEATLTIRAADLRAVEERFQFRNSDWVEISEKRLRRWKAIQNGRRSPSSPSRSQVCRRFGESGSSEVCTGSEQI